MIIQHSKNWEPITANWKEYLGKYDDPIITTTEILTFNTSQLIIFFQLMGG